MRYAVFVTGKSTGLNVLDYAVKADFSVVS